VGIFLAHVQLWSGKNPRKKIATAAKNERVFPIKTTKGKKEREGKGAQSGKRGRRLAVDF